MSVIGLIGGPIAVLWFTAINNLVTKINNAPLFTFNKEKLLIGVSIILLISNCFQFYIQTMKQLEFDYNILFYGYISIYIFIRYIVLVKK